MNAKILIIAGISLLLTSLSDILYCNERRKLFERAALYRSEIILWVLTIARILQIPLVIYLGFLNWKALVAVALIAMFSLRLFLDGFVERFIVLPIYLVLNYFSEHPRKHK